MEHLGPLGTSVDPGSSLERFAPGENRAEGLNAVPPTPVARPAHNPHGPAPLTVEQSTRFMVLMLSADIRLLTADTSSRANPVTASRPSLSLRFRASTSNVGSANISATKGRGSLALASSAFHSSRHMLHPKALREPLRPQGLATSPQPSAMRPPPRDDLID